MWNSAAILCTTAARETATFSRTLSAAGSFARSFSRMSTASVAKAAEDSAKTKASRSSGRSRVTSIVLVIDSLAGRAIVVIGKVKNTGRCPMSEPRMPVLSTRQEAVAES